MEIMAAHLEQSYCQNIGSVCSPLNLALTSPPENPREGNKTCGLLKTEISPAGMKPVKNDAAENNGRSCSPGAEGLKEEKLKENDMENLLKRLPILNHYFQLHKKIGGGAFSSVYLATLRNSSSNENYAVKHLTQKCQQLSIEGEFRCMNEIGGKDNVVHANHCLTNGDDCVTFIMPYLPHEKFRDYVLDMNADETRVYMKNLFIALRRVHSFNIIHRDVKPPNFLYNRETKEFLLVDFGLAQVVQNPNHKKSKETVAVDENVPIDYSKKRKRRDSMNEKEKTTPVKRSRRMALKLKDNNVRLPQMYNFIGNMNFSNNEVSLPDMNSDAVNIKSPIKQYPNKTNLEKTPLKLRTTNAINGNSSSRRKRLFDVSSPEDSNLKGMKTNLVINASPAIPLPKEKGAVVADSSPHENLRDKSFTPLVPSKSTSGSFVQVRNSRVVRQCEMIKSKPGEIFQRPKPKAPRIGEQCSCSGRGAICARCATRSKMVAPRAGTPGFRPPEVLFKYINQTTAVDMWASGVILLCILSGCYPFFKSHNDLDALAEIMTVFGTEPVIKIAAKFGRRVVCNIEAKGVDLKKLCKILRARSAKRSNNEKKNSNEAKCKDCHQTIKKDGCLCISDNPSEDNRMSENEDASSSFPDSAFDLLKRLLDLDPTTRITATEALEHPFILGL